MMVASSPRPLAPALARGRSPAEGRGCAGRENPSPLCGRGWPASAGRVRGRGAERLLDRRPHAVQVVQHVVVPEANYAKALALQVGGSRGITLGRVLAAVNFDDQAPLGAEEVDDVAVDLDLLAEFEAMELATAEDAPELSFGVSRVLAQRPRPAGHEMVPCHVAPSPRPCGPTLSRGGERVLARHALSSVHGSLFVNA